MNHVAKSTSGLIKRKNKKNNKHSYNRNLREKSVEEPEVRAPSDGPQGLRDDLDLWLCRRFSETSG